MTLPNPYAPGALPRVLAGRAPELERVRGHLARVAAFGELAGPPMIFTGPRGVGKTSLLRAAEGDAAERGFVCAWASCTRGQPFLPELVNRVGRALEDHEVVPRQRRGRWKARLQQVGVEVGVPGLTAHATMATDPPGDPAPPPAPIAAVEDLLHEAAILVRERGGAGLLVLLDEWHAPRRVDTAVFLNALQNLGGAAARNPLAVLAAGLPSTPEALVRAATFGERSTFVELPRLDQAAVTEAVREPARRLGVEWDVDALAVVADWARGYPYFVQLVAGSTWEAAGPQDGRTLAASDVAAGLPAAIRQMTAMFRARWRAASALEQRLMAAMAGGEGAGETARRGDIAAALGVTSDSLGVPRDRLIDKGILEPAGHGELRFTLPGFAAYVREQAPAGSPSGEADQPPGSSS